MVQLAEPLARLHGRVALGLEHRASPERDQDEREQRQHVERPPRHIERKDGEREREQPDGDPSERVHRRDDPQRPPAFLRGELLGDDRDRDGPLGREEDLREELRAGEEREVRGERRERRAGRVADDRDQQQPLAADPVGLRGQHEPRDGAEAHDRPDPAGLRLGAAEVDEDQREDERQHEVVVALEERGRRDEEQELAPIAPVPGWRRLAVDHGAVAHGGSPARTALPPPGVRAPCEAGPRTRRRRPVGRVAGRHDRRAVRERQPRTERTSPVTTGLRPASLGAPDPDRDHRGAGGQCDPRDPASHPLERAGSALTVPSGAIAASAPRRIVAIASSRAPSSPPPAGSRSARIGAGSSRTVDGRTPRPRRGTATRAVDARPSRSRGTDRRARSRG